MKLEPLPQTQYESTRTNYLMLVNNSNLDVTFRSYTLDKRVYSDNHGKMIALFTNEFYDPVHDHTYEYLIDSSTQKLGVHYWSTSYSKDVQEVNEYPVSDITVSNHTKAYVIHHNKVIVGYMFVTGYSREYLASINSVEDLIKRSPE